MYSPITGPICLVSAGDYRSKGCHYCEAIEASQRAADAALALWWAWVLLRSLLAGRIGGEKGFKSHRGQRPGQIRSNVVPLIRHLGMRQVNAIVFHGGTSLR